MFTFAIDYYLFVFAASLGVIQIEASLGSLKGLLILKSPLIARASGLALTVAAFVWFFLSDTRNVNDYEGGLDANYQALNFIWGVLTGVAVTLVAATLVNARMNGGDRSTWEGLDALKHTNYGRALAHSVRYWRREWRTQTRSYFSG